MHKPSADPAAAPDTAGPPPPRRKAPLGVISEGMGHDSETTIRIDLASPDTSFLGPKIAAEGSRQKDRGAYAGP